MSARFPEGSQRTAVAIGALAVAVAAVGCGNDATGVDACRQIEEARCRKAPACSAIILQPPFHGAGSNADACIRFYDDACLHGLDVADPGPTAVAACVHAIESDGCAVVSTPQSDPACAWLVPPSSSPVDASDQQSGEGAVEGGDGSQ